MQPIMKPVIRLSLLEVTLALASGATFAATPHAVKESAAQLKADTAALHRQLGRLQADEARLKTDTASGRLSAESQDAYAVYRTKHALTGEATAVAADTNVSIHMK